jgi:ATPase family AAA domain-containing protein 2
MDLDIVNDRLWNGYYLTPDQFVYDIQCMVHDSKTWPDRDRTNRAEEMLVNTQSYVSEVFDETLILECQRMAEREFERQKILQAERDAKAKKKAERDKEKERLRLLAAATQQNQEGQSPTKMIDFPTAGDVQVTEANGDSTSGLGILLNGNGEGILDDPENHFVPESSPFGSQQFPSEGRLFPPSTRSTSPTRTQSYPQMPAHNEAGLTPPLYNSFSPPMPQPTLQAQPYVYPNMQHSQHQQSPFPGPYHPANPATSMYPQPTYSDSTFPPAFQSDTPQNLGGFTNLNHQMSTPQFPQPVNQFYQSPHTPGQPYGGTQPTSNQSSAMVVTPQNHGSPTKTVPPRLTATPHPPLRKDPARVVKLLQDVTRQTEGYTLEQLEQVYAVCMDIIWRLRHEWDRTVVITETEKCARRVMSEIEMMKRERHKDRLDIGNL